MANTEENRAHAPKIRHAGSEGHGQVSARAPLARVTCHGANRTGPTQRVRRERVSAHAEEGRAALESSVLGAALCALPGRMQERCRWYRASSREHHSRHGASGAPAFETEAKPS